MDSNEALQLINPTVRNLKAYHLEPEETAVKLNQNENPWDWPADIKEAVARFCRQRPWNRYPEFVPTTLKDALARYAHALPENIVVGNGSNEVLLVLLLSLMPRRGSVIICQPTFTVYRLLVSGLGGSEIDVPLRPDLSFDVRELCRAAAENPGSVLILASPNNPTGSSLSQTDLRAILDVHRGFLVLDQAYVEFGAYDAVELVREYANLVVTRTFSKALGGAALRLGYLIGDRTVVAEINKIKLPYNVNSFSEFTAGAILSHGDLVGRRTAEIVRERDRLYDFLRSAGFDACYPSDANFVLVRTATKPQLMAFLKSRGILVRDVSSYPMLEHCLRISVGTPEENATVRQAIEEFFALHKSMHPCAD